MRDERWPAVSRSGEVDGVQIALANEPIQMDVEQTQSRRRSQVAEQPRLDVLGPDRLTQDWIVLQEDLADGEAVRRLPVAVHAIE